MDINASPKAILIQDATRVKAHKLLVQNETFTSGVDASLLQYQRYLGQKDVESSEAAANHYKMVGAMEFVAVLKTLAETPQIPKAANIATLDHRA